MLATIAKQKFNSVSLPSSFPNAFFLSSKVTFMGFPGGSVVKKPPANAGDVRLRSLILKDPTCHRATKHVFHDYWPLSTASEPQLLSPRVQLLKPACPRASAQQQRCLHNEDQPLQLGRSPHSPQLEKARTATKQRPSTAKNTLKINKSTKKITFIILVLVF